MIMEFLLMAFTGNLPQQMTFLLALLALNLSPIKGIMWCAV